MLKSCEKQTTVKGCFTVGNDRGLHTRPSAELVKCAARFKCRISLVHRKMRVNAKSMLGILMLAAAKGARVRIEAEGDDALQAIASLSELASKNFNIKY